MKDEKELVKLIDKNTVQDDSYLKRKTIVCYFLQTLPWLLYLVVIILISIVNAISKITEKNNILIESIRYSATGVAILIMIIGLILACKNKARGLCIILLLIFLIDFTIMSACYLSMLIGKEFILYGYVLVVTFLVIIVSHLLGIIGLGNQDKLRVYSISMWITSVLVPPGIFILDEVFDPDNVPFQLFLEILAGVLISATCFASMLTSIKTSFTVK